MGFFNLEDFILWSKRTPRWWRTLFRLYRIVEEISSEEILWSLTFLTKKDDNLDNLHKTTFPKAQEYCREKNLKFDFIFHMWHVRYLTCSISYVYKLFKWLKMKKSVKIKTWFTKEEVFKFSSLFYETELDANMIRYGGSKSTSKFLFDDKIIRLVQRWDFESLISRTYVFTGSKRLNKTHFEDEFGEKGWFSDIQN